MENEIISNSLDKKNHRDSTILIPGFNKCVTCTRFVSKACGVWPDFQESNSFLSRFYFVVPASMILFSLMVPQFRRIIIKRRDLNEVIECLSTAFVVDAIAVWKLLGVSYNQTGLRKLIIAIAEDWKRSSEKEKVVMWKYAKLSHLIISFGLTLTCGNVIGQGSRVYIIYFVQVYYAVGNETIHKPFFAKCDFYYELQESPVHEIVYTVQVIASFYATFSFISCDGFFVFSVLHFSAQFENLQAKLESLLDKQKEWNCSFANVLIPMIHRHRHLCRYTSTIEDNFNKIFLFQILATSILICLQGYEFALVFTETGTEMVVHLIFIICFLTSMIVSILTYCYVAEILRTQSEQLFHSAYNISWYDLKPDESKLLIIIMNRTRLPIEITMGKFVAFSLPYFCSVMKTTAGYLSVLLAMKDKL